MKLTHAALLLSFSVRSLSGQGQPDPLVRVKELERTSDLEGQKQVLLDALAQTPERNVRTAAWRVKLGSVFLLNGEFGAAQVHLLEARAIYEVEKGVPLNSLPDCLHALAMDHAALSQWKQAEAAFLQAIKIYDERFGRNSRRVISSLEGLAAVYIELGRLAECRPLLDRSQDLMARFLEVDDKELMVHLTSRGRLELVLGQYAASAALLERARSIGRKKPDVLAFHLGWALSLLGTVRYFEGNLGRAEAHWREALTIGEAHRDPQRVVTALLLSQILIERSNWIGAEALIEAQREIFEKSLGTEHAVYAQALELMGRVRMGQKRWAEAEKLFRDSLQRLEQATGLNGIHTASVRNDLGLLYLKMRRYADACVELEGAISSTEKILGSAHAALVEYFELYSICLRHLGKSKEAKAARRHSAEIQAKQQPAIRGIVDLSNLRH